MIMRIIDCTPPADFPDQVIMTQSAAFIERHPEAAHYLRIKSDGNNVKVVQLTGAIGTGHARQMAREMGYDPTHWTFPGEGEAFRFCS